MGAPPCRGEVVFVILCQHDIMSACTHLTRRHIEQPLRRAAGLARGAEAGAVLGGEGLAAGHEPNTLDIEMDPDITGVDVYSFPART